jgi:mRNA-degrading endonuclease RelE of RelBE toxin-antitoxin system/DNA-binding XRE family transcriptional regulator
MAAVTITPDALKQAERLPAEVRARVRRLALRLAHWPEVSGAKPLSGNLAGRYRMRTGDYRVQFYVQGDNVIVEKIGHRDGFYEGWIMATNYQTLTLAGQRFVIIPEIEFHRMARNAGELSLPPRDAKGNYPAAEALQVSIARSILRSRRAAGLTQADLAKTAGIRPETLNRIENGKHAPSVATVEKIERALAKTARTRRR